jgi:hypothetical protein
MSTDPETRRAGDPAFAGSSAITHEPVVEEDRPTIADNEGLRRPFPWIVVFTFAAIAGLALVAGLAAGWAYAIPFVVVAALVAAFIGALRGRRTAPADSESAVPSIDLDERE